MGGYNCNSMFENIDFEMIRKHPKILCGYSDPTSLLNMIYAKTGLVTFHGPNFKSLCSEESDYGYRQVIKRFLQNENRLREDTDEFVVIQEGQAEGILMRWKFITFYQFDSGKISSRYKR